MATTEYEEKRHFARTPEPAPKMRAGQGPLRFVIQKHAARRLHYDFRIEVDGVLKSWAIPSGPSLDPKVKRLAVMVEDHPLDYASFEGVIPKGEYGAGEVIVWDNGTYSPDKEGQYFFDDREKAQEVMRDGLARGSLKVFLRGNKLNGSWALVKMNRKDDWLLIKHQDEFASLSRDVTEEAASVVSGAGIEDLKAGRTLRATFNPAEIPGSREDPFPNTVAPMLATLTDKPFADPEWVFEPKLDGYRAIALIQDGNVTLLSRRGNDITREYQFLADELKQLPGRLVLDGEIVAVDEVGRPCFQCLQEHLSDPRPESSILYYIFDILHVNGYDLTGVALEQRRKLLEATLRSSPHIHLVEQVPEDGHSIYSAATAIGLEGVIAKRKDSRYEPGRRSTDWLKVKRFSSDDFVIAGFSEGKGNRAAVFGSLLLGYYDPSGKLIYAGNVGSGFDEAGLADLSRRLLAIKTDDCPFEKLPPLHGPTTWVKPELVAEIKFTERTREDYLRNPVFLRLRPDKSTVEVKPTATASPDVAPAKSGKQPGGDIEGILQQINEGGDSPTIEVEGYKVSLGNLDKAYWPPHAGRPAITKRQLLDYIVRVSPYILSHLLNRPLTLTRYPDGVKGDSFYQKHVDYLPDFVHTVRLAEHESGLAEYLLCNNLATLIWLAQIADIEIHTWFSRISPDPDLLHLDVARNNTEYLAEHPDFIIFDLDPYIYSGKEAGNAEPELNRAAFDSVSEVALWLKEILDSLSLSSFVKTSGKTGLHIFVPVIRQFDYRSTRSAAATIGRFLWQRHPGKITSDWAVEKRTGMVFFDYNQNVRGKTVASAYSPRPTPQATVSTPLSWDEVGKIFPTDFTILSMPDRLERTGDLWKDILNKKQDLKKILEIGT